MRLWAFAILLFGCTELADVARLRCGNGLHEDEANEDCDGLPVDSPYTCGAPATANACRLLCDTTACPTGWACGADAVCRFGTGRFEPSKAINMPGNFMQVADLDADGFADVITQSFASLQVGYGTREGALEDIQVRAQARGTIPSAIGDADGDGLHDVLTYSSEGPLLFRGRRDRRLVPDAVSSSAPDGELVFMAPVRATASPVNQRALMIWQNTAGVVARYDTAPVDVGILGLYEDGTVPPQMAIADLDADASMEEIAFFAVDGDTVVIATLDCRQDCALTVRQSLPLPRGHRLRSTHFGDVDADGFIDLVVGTHTDALNTHLVSYGGVNGLGPLTAEEALATLDHRRDLGRIVNSNQLFAVVDVSGDARAEFIVGDAVYVQAGQPTRLERIHQVPDPYSTYQPVDLDADGRLDLVAGNGTELHRIVFEGDGLSVSTQPVDGTGGVAVGDFDADGLPDTATLDILDGALRVRLSSDPTTPDDVPIAAILDPVPTGLISVRTQRRLSQAFLPDTLVAAGSGARFVLNGSALGLPTSRHRIPGQARDMAIGRFFDGEPGLVVTAHAMGARAQRYRFQVEPAVDSRFQPFDDPCLTSTRAPALAVAIDVDGDQVDELLTLTSGHLQVENMDLPVLPGGDNEVPGPDGSQVWRMHRVQLQGDGAECLWTGNVRSVEVPQRLFMADVDEDGFDDIVALLIPRLADPNTMGATARSKLAVWPGTSAGHGSPQVFDLPVGIIAATPIALPGRPSHIALAGEAGGLTTAWRDGQLVFEDIDLNGRPVRAFHSGDVDGDGLDDLIIKTTTTVFVHRQHVCTARAAWEGQCTRPAP